MKKPFAISIGFHAAFLLAALIVLPTPKPFEVKPQEAIQVDISTISDKTQQMATAKDATPKVDRPAPKQTPVVKDVPPAPKVDDKINNAVNVPKDPPPAPPVKPEPPKPKPVPEDPVPPEPVDPVVKAPPPKPKPPEPKPVDTAALDSLLKKVDEPKPAPPKEAAKPTEKPSDKKKPELKLDEIAALLNKDKGEHTAPQKPAENTGAPKAATTDSQGNDAALAATLRDAMRQKLKECWDKPQAAIDSGVEVDVAWNMDQQGNVQGKPQVTGGSFSDTLFNITAQSAISAVISCQPFDFLPRDKFDVWSNFEWKFKP